MHRNYLQSTRDSTYNNTICRRPTFRHDGDYLHGYNHHITSPLTAELFTSIYTDTTRENYQFEAYPPKDETGAGDAQVHNKQKVPEGTQEVPTSTCGAWHAAASDRGIGVNPRLPRNRRKFPHLLVVSARNSSDMGPVGFR